MKKIGSCLWFNNQAEEAAKFYGTIFDTKIKTTTRYSEASSKASGQPVGSVMTVDMEIENRWVLGLNGGPMFKFTPSFSFFVTCNSEAEITQKWKALSAGGQVRMGLDKYPWAERYGWTSDKFGVEWQLIYTNAPSTGKLAPSFLFTDKLFGKGQEAVDLYTSIFPNSKIETKMLDEKSKTIAHCRFSLNGDEFTLMEGAGEHGHSFNEAFSLMVPCDTQDEIDRYWSKLTAQGGQEGPCGWLKDKFGVSWQIVWSEMETMMRDPNKAQKAMSAILKMKKLDIAQIKAAAQS
jgi:predicted 3-demethylubiquinone-9 3-methyltransferase (glyoxalase superfamily)